MRSTNITRNKKKIRTYLQSLWNQRRTLHYLQLVIRKVIYRKTILKNVKVYLAIAVSEFSSPLQGE